MDKTAKKGLLGFPAFPLVPLAIAGALAVPHLPGNDAESELSTKFNDAQARGETPMSDSFHNYVQRRKHSNTQKEANMKAPAAAAGAMGNVVDKLLMKTRSVPTHELSPHEVASRLARGGQEVDLPIRGASGQQGPIHQHIVDSTFSPGRAALAVGGLGAVGTAYNAATTSADNPLQYKIQKALYGPEDRVQMQDEFLKGLSSQGGKETAGLLSALLGEGAGQAVQGAKALPRGHQQSRTFQDAMSTDEMLREAPPQDQELLQRAFQTMQKFAPELAHDEFAVKNYLRESLMAANGPDYATIGNLARTNRDISDQGRR